MTKSYGKLLNRVYEPSLLRGDKIDEARLGGVVYTPISVATEIVRVLEQSFLNKSISIMEPSVGDGAFIEAIRQSELKVSSCKVIDIDKNAVRRNRSRTKHWLGSKATAHASEFVSYSNKNQDIKFDLIIGNPPFVKRQNFSDCFKLDIKKLAETCQYEANELKNAWAAFVLASANMLRDDGVLAFVLPHELMTVNYSFSLQKKLRTIFNRVDIFVPREKAFKNIDQDAVVLICKNTTIQPHGLFVSPVESLSNLSSKKSRKITVSGNDNIGSDLAGFLFDEKTNALIQRIRSEANVIGDYCDSSPGVVTAANEFFIISETLVERLDAWEFAKPILQKAAFLENKIIFDHNDFDRIRSAGKPAYFLDLKDANDAHFSKELRAYISQGEDRGLHKRYKCRKRSPWFGVPSVWSSNSYFFKRSHLLPRLCLNEANVLVTDTAYRIKLNKKVSDISLGYSFYNPITLLFAELDGRFYGGGVLELTPREFKGLPIALFPTSKKMHSSLCKKYASYLSDFSMLSRDKKSLSCKHYGLELHEYIRICKAYDIARSHRLRH